MREKKEKTARFCDFFSELQPTLRKSQGIFIFCAEPQPLIYISHPLIYIICVHKYQTFAFCTTFAAMRAFELHSDYQPTGDQPEAIRQLTQGVKDGEPAQVLLGVTGSGKTFTVANVIAQVGKPTLVLSHNKTLAAQLYTEFKSFFPNNAV